MDNLYISTKFAKFSFTHPKKVMIAGVARTSGRGIPLSVLQYEKKDQKEVVRVRGTVKAAVLMGDKSIPNLVAVSVYDTKPVDFISTICNSIEWVPLARKVWNESKQEMDVLKFLRLNVNDDYNKDMNACDVADQLQNNYRFDLWMRNFKWWWAKFLWGYGDLVVNSYVTYTSLMDDFKIPKRLRFTHYGFRKACVRIWMDPNGEQVLRQWKQNRSSVSSQASQASEVAQANSASETPRSRSRSPNFPRFASPAVSTISDLTPNTHCSPCSPNAFPSKSPRFDSNTLSSNGRLSSRLDFFGKKHLPISREAAGKSKETSCALQRWAVGRECKYRNGVQVCKDCNVPLCVECYEVFHSIEDIPSRKEEIKTILENKAREERSKSPNRAGNSPLRKRRKAS